mmetsp:Transcript_6302/g.39239  ORF Transcript_6302/g.39239 Transcript_6302/m.39239 type:complete len:228 (+) Transcript_6302:3555-4238(+)
MLLPNLVPTFLWLSIHFHRLAMHPPLRLPFHLSSFPIGRIPSLAIGLRTPRACSLRPTRKTRTIRRSAAHRAPSAAPALRRPRHIRPTLPTASLSHRHRRNFASETSISRSAKGIPRGSRRRTDAEVRVPRSRILVRSAEVPRQLAALRRARDRDVRRAPSRRRRHEAWRMRRTARAERRPAAFPRRRSCDVRRRGWHGARTRFAWRSRIARRVRWASPRTTWDVVL